MYRNKYSIRIITTLMMMMILWLHTTTTIFVQCEDISYQSECKGAPPPSLCNGKIRKFVSLWCYPYWCKRTTQFDKIYDRLKTRIYGQQQALNQIRAVLRPIIDNTDISKEMLMKSPSSSSTSFLPPLLYLVGDNGVGKSLSASIISENLFEYHQQRTKEHQKSLLYLDGQDYAAPPDENLRQTHAIMFANNIRNKIVEKLRVCPKSIIIIDELQNMMSEVFLRLSQMFEGTIHDPRYGTISTQHAIFIFTSDLGYQDETRNLTYTQLRDRIYEVTNQWLMNDKILDRMHIIPYQSLDVNAIEHVIRYELDLLPCHYNEMRSISYTSHIVKHLGNMWWSYDSARKRNARGIWFEIITSTIMPLINTQLDALSSQGITQPIHFHLSKQNDTLIVFCT